MANLWTFGDSFTESYTPPNPSIRHWRHSYIEWKKYNTKVYGEFISEELDLNLINKGLGGCDNAHIFEEFCKVCSKIEENDIVIFGWTSQNRFRLANKNDRWGHFNKDSKSKNGFFSHKSLDTFEFISENTIMELILNRNNKLFGIEVRNWAKLINFSLKNNQIIHWTWDRNLSNVGIMWCGAYETITEETNGEIQDPHWSENGHREFSKFLINQIKEDEKNKLI